jgi:iron complex outermembrane recepter protein
MAYPTLKFGAMRVKFSVFGRNLLDDRGRSATLPLAGLLSFAGGGPPRRFGGEIGIKF